MGLVLRRCALPSMGTRIAITSAAGQGACMALHLQYFCVDNPGKTFL